MPTYTYRCEDCDFEFDVKQTMKAKKLKYCPNCEKPELKQVIRPSNFVLRGSGWFKDGY